MAWLGRIVVPNSTHVASTPAWGKKVGRVLRNGPKGSETATRPPRASLLAPPARITSPPDWRWPTSTAQGEVLGTIRIGPFLMLYGNVVGFQDTQVRDEQQGD